ncbi:MAG: SIMPL domain-containing protein, partial [Gammaproteobacteria bacterium]
MRQILSLLLATSLSVATAAGAGDPRLVTVSGSGEVLAEPDLASLGIGVEARAPSVDAARRQVNDTVRAVLDLTRASGIAQEQVSSAALMVRPDHQWMPESRQQKLLGYVVTRRINIRLTDISMLGEV